MTVLVLVSNADAVVDGLRARGVDALAVPVLRFEPLPPPSLDELRGAPLDVLVTSPRTVDAVVALVRDPQWRVLALAPKTSAALRARGVVVDDEVEGGAAALAGRARPGPVVLFTSDLGGDEALSVRPDLRVVPVYKTVAPPDLPEAAWAALSGDYALLAASPSALRYFDLLAPGAVARARRVWCRGATTFAEARRLGATTLLEGSP